MDIKNYDFNYIFAAEEKKKKEKFISHVSF